MNAEPVLILVTRVLVQRRLDAVLIGNAAAAIQGSPVTPWTSTSCFRRRRRISRNSSESRTTWMLSCFVRFTQRRSCTA